MYMYRERSTDRVKRKAVQTRHLISSKPRWWEWKQSSLHKYTSTDNLSSQASSSPLPATAHLLLSRLNLTLLLHIQQAHTQHLAAANFNPTEEDEGEGEGRCRDAVWWRGTTTVGRKERGRCASGKPGNLTADWLESFHSPAAAPICCCCYCAGVFVLLYYCACESGGDWEIVEVGSKCSSVWKHL